jgi:hypothetical protein
MPRTGPMTQEQKDRKQSLRRLRESKTAPTDRNPNGFPKPYNPGPWKSPEPKPWERLGIK